MAGVLPDGTLPPSIDSIQEWTAEDVSKHLRSYGLGKTAEIFTTENIDGWALLGIASSVATPSDPGPVETHGNTTLRQQIAEMIGGLSFGERVKLNSYLHNVHSCAMFRNRVQNQQQPVQAQQPAPALRAPHVNGRHVAIIDEAEAMLNNTGIASHGSTLGSSLPRCPSVDSRSTGFVCLGHELCEASCATFTLNRCWQ